MGYLTENRNKNAETEAASGTDGQTAVREIPRFAKNGVRWTLVLTALFFTLYMAGSMPDPGLPDATLFWLLRLLRYAAFLLCVFSTVSMAFNVHRVVYAPCLRRALGTLLYFLLGLLGAVLVMFTLLIVGMIRGN